MFQRTANSAGPRSVVLAAAWRARWIILAAVLVAGVGGYLISKSQPATYSAQTRIVLAASDAFDPLGSQLYGDPSRFVANQVSLIGTQPVLTLAATRLNDGTSAAELGKDLSVTASSTDDVLTVSTTGPTADAAVGRADAVVAAYRQFVSQHVQQSTRAATAATTDPTVADQIRTRAAIYGDGVAVVDPAFSSGSPSAPSPIRDGVILAVVAALITFGLALWRRPHDNGASSLLAEAPVLGTVEVRRGRGRLAGSPQYALAMVALDYARQGSGGAALIAGVGRESGAASVAFGLATAAVLQGRRVLLVDAAPGSRELLSRTGAPRLTASLDTLQAAPEPGNGVMAALPVASPGAGELVISMLGADESRPVNNEALCSALSRVAGSFDLVILQSAPLSESPLAFALAGHVETVVAAMGAKDQPGLLTAMSERLDSAHRPLTGVVVTRPTRSDTGTAKPPVAAPAGPSERAKAPELSTPIR